MNPSTKSGRRWLRGARRALTVLIFAICLGVVVLAVAVRLGGLRLEPVLSGSMRPTLQPGDLVVIRPTPVASLHKGEVIEFLPPGQTVPRIHRIASISRQRDKQGEIVTTITTRGDANDAPDPWGKITLAGTTAYQLAMAIPSLGWVAQAPKGIIIPACVILAGLLALVTAGTRLSRMFPRLRRPPAGEPQHKEA